jgi:hypothetical protein
MSIRMLGMTDRDACRLQRRRNENGMRMLQFFEASFGDTPPNDPNKVAFERD